MKKITALFFILFLISAGNKKLFAQAAKSTPEWTKNATIYEVNLRQYSPSGTFNEFAKQLPRLKDMGVQILWLMPINPIGELNRKGSLGSYYSIRDYLTVNPEYGTLDDFKNLVNTIHSMGMYVIIDWVANHSAWDNPLIKQHPEWYTKDKDGNIISPNPDWTDVADFNYANPALRSFMTDAMKYWMRETNIDGFRCDVAFMVPMDFWNDTRRQLEKIKPVFMLAEAEGPELHSAFEMTYTWNAYNTMNEMAKGNRNVVQLDSVIRAQMLYYPSGSYRMYFTSNHDENSWNGTEFERLGNAAQTYAVLCATIPGMPLVYSGQEIALKKRLKFFDKDTINWTAANPYEKFYSVLLNLKKNNPALWNGNYGGSFITLNTANNIYAYMRAKDNSKVIVILNFNNKNETVKLSGDTLKGKYKNAFTGRTKKLKSKNTVNLKPYEYIVLSK